MTKDDIIRMAREVGLVSICGKYDDWIDAGPSGEELMAFAQLVAIAEREACAKIFDRPEWNEDVAQIIRARGQQ